MSANLAAAGSPHAVALRLYIAGGTPSSRRADENLKKALLLASPDIACEVIDVLSDSRRAMSDNVIVTPTLVGSVGTRRLVLIGDLADETKLRGFLSSLSGGD